MSDAGWDEALRTESPRWEDYCDRCQWTVDICKCPEGFKQRVKPDERNCECVTDHDHNTCGAHATGLYEFEGGATEWRCLAHNPLTVEKQAHVETRRRLEAAEQTIAQNGWRNPDDVNREMVDAKEPLSKEQLAGWLTATWMPTCHVRTIMKRLEAAEEENIRVRERSTHWCNLAGHTDARLAAVEGALVRVLGALRATKEGDDIVWVVADWAANRARPPEATGDLTDALRHADAILADKEARE